MHAQHFRGKRSYQWVRQYARHVDRLLVLEFGFRQGHINAMSTLEQRNETRCACILFGSAFREL